MIGPSSDRREYVKALIADIDDMQDTARADMRQLNAISRYLKHHRDAGNITVLHYNVDRERLKRTMSKCKLLLFTLTQHRKQALKLLEDIHK